MASVVNMLVAFFLHGRCCGRSQRACEEQEGRTAWSDLDVRMADLEQSRSQQRRLQAEVRGAPDRLVHISRKKWKEVI